MHLKNTISKFLFSYLVFCFHSTLAIANAPSDPTGYKITLKIKSSVDSEGNVDDQEETHIQYFTSITTALNRDGDNGQWYPESISWTKTSNTDVKLLLGVITDSYADVSLYFPNPTTGTFTFDYYDSDNGLPLKKVSSGSGTFTFNAYENSSLPFDHYFTDSFDKSSESTNLWPLRTYGGVTTTVKDSKFVISGTDYDLDNRWQGINANTILSLKKDWIVDGSAFNKIDDYRSSSLAAVGVDAEVEEGGFSFDISIGKQGTRTILAEIYVESFNSYSDQYTSIWTDSLADEEDFRLINTCSSNTIYAQYFANGKWNTLSQLNWKTGDVTEKNIQTGDDSSFKFTNWLNPEFSLVAPFMDFVMPHYYDNESNANVALPLQEGDLGFSSFSVTEGPPFDVPSSIEGKKISVNYTLDDGSTGTNEFFFGSRGELWSHYNVGDSSAFWDQETFTWTSSQNSSVASSEIQNDSGRIVSGTLNFTDSSIGSLSLVFYELLNGQKVQNGTAFGTFSISDYSANELPATKGWMWFDEYPWVYSHEEGGWLYFQSSGSKLMVYSANDQVWRDMSK